MKLPQISWHLSPSSHEIALFQKVTWDSVTKFGHAPQTLILGIWQCWRYPRTGKMLNSCLAESEFRKNFCGTSYAAPNAPNMTPKSHARARFHNPKCVHTPAKTKKFGNCTWRKVTFITISYNNRYRVSRVTRIAEIRFLNTLMAV